MNHIDESVLQELREKLEDEGYAIEQQISERAKKDETGNWTGSVDEENGEESERVDTADNLEELGINVAVVEDLEQRERDIADALDRMDDGSYGLCEECGEEIPVERLEAEPIARMCIEHAQ